MPEIASGARIRAEELGLSVSTFVGILIRNQHLAPKALSAEADSLQLTREHFPMSWRGDLRQIATRQAKKEKLTTNALVEALIARELRSTEHGLMILPARTSRQKPKP